MTDPPEELARLKARWTAFVNEHRTALRAGMRFPHRFRGCQRRPAAQLAVAEGGKTGRNGRNGQIEVLMRYRSAKIRLRSMIKPGSTPTGACSPSPKVVGAS